MPQCNAGKLAFLPGHRAPIHETIDCSQGGTVVMVVEELIEDIGRTDEPESLGSGQMVLEVRRLHILHGRSSARDSDFALTRTVRAQGSSMKGA
jgi:hypothetical protein